jgi:glucose-6-phosphate 1-dehydrogenase
MSVPRSDALVVFGASGDLAFKKIFPALAAMVRRGHLDVPVVGVARTDWTLEQFRDRARESIQKHGRFDEATFAKLSGLMHYVAGDYGHPVTMAALRRELGSACRPLHYLAIPRASSRPSHRAWARRTACATPASSSRSRSGGTSSRRGS